MTRQTLYIESPGTILRRNGGALVVERESQTILRVPLHRLIRVMLWRQTHVTTPALRMLLRAGVDVALLSTRGLVGSIRAPVSGSVALLLAQVDCHRDPGRALMIGRDIIAAKLHSQAEVLASARRSPVRSQLLAAAAALRAQIARVTEAPDVQTLRGLEGSATRTYFSAFGQLINPPLRFEGRNRRPPRDPINALLSLGYMLLSNEVRGDLEGRGFDPRLGLVHVVRAGRPALALDMMEPWRAPVVDRLVANLANLGVLGPDDFDAEGEGVRLTPPALARFVDAWEAHLGPREVVQADALPSLRQQMAAWIDGVEARIMGATQAHPASGLGDTA